MSGAYSEPPSISRVRVTHYWTKSVEEFLLKKLKRGDLNNQTMLSDAHGLIMPEKKYNDGEDRMIQRFVEPLRRRLRGSDNNGR